TEYSTDDDKEVGAYVVHYADETKESIPIIYGKDLRDWWNADQGEISRAKIAWEGTNKAAEGFNAKIRLFSLAWKNPKPDKKVERVVFESANTACSPFLVAMSLEPDQATASVQAGSAAVDDGECPDKVRIEPGSVIMNGKEGSGRVVIQLNGESDDQPPGQAGQERGRRRARGPKVWVQANPVVPVPHVGHITAPTPPQPPLPPSLEGIGLPPQLIAELDQAPAWFLIPEDVGQPKLDPRGLRTIKGPPSATPEKAEKDARAALAQKAAD